MNDRQREQARIRQARRRARLKEEGASVTVTLTKQEEAMLQELCRVRRPGRTAYSTNEFFQLLLIRNWQQWQEQKAQLGKCQACEKLKAEGGCGGERQSETFNCWLAVALAKPVHANKNRKKQCYRSLPGSLRPGRTAYSTNEFFSNCC
ncbi:hypothetical protein QT352_29625 (plasmid) [Escherichia coli]|nr:hypothetical protein [Escherichia coli]